MVGVLSVQQFLAQHSSAARCVFVGFTVIGTRRSVGA